MSFGYKSEEESYQLTMLSEPFININSFNRLQREKKMYCTGIGKNPAYTNVTGSMVNLFSSFGVLNVYNKSYIYKYISYQ